jgi:hypothetical protein
MSGAQTMWLLGVVAAGALVQSVAGFGFALLAVPLASLVVAPGRAVVVVSLANLVSSMRVSAASPRRIDRAVAARLLAGALMGMPIGLYVLEVVGDRTLRLVIGVVVALIALTIASGVEFPSGAWRADLTAGLISGVLTTSTGTNGPPLVIRLRARGMDLPVLRATLGVVFAVSGAAAVTLFAWRGQIHRDQLKVAVLSVPAQLGVGWAGDRVAAHLGPARFARVVIVALLASAVAAVVSGLTR